MSHSFPELDVLEISVDRVTRDRHLAAISRSLHDPWRQHGRRRLLAIALAVVLLVPVMALAAERALPGDFLYPFKRNVVEPVVSVVDRDVAAVHRVEEVEDMLAEEASIDVLRDRVAVARDAASDSPELNQRIDHVVEDLDRRESDEQKQDSPIDGTTREDPDEGRDMPASTTEPLPDTTEAEQDSLRGDVDRDD